MARKLETKFQSDLKQDIYELFPGCFIFKQDANAYQGIPDLLILWGNRWAMLEVKRKRPTSASDFEPNQEWYIEHFNQMSFAACIYPENKDEVLYGLQSALQSPGYSRFPGS